MSVNEERAPLSSWLKIRCELPFVQLVIARVNAPGVKLLNVMVPARLLKSSVEFAVRVRAPTPNALLLPSETAEPNLMVPPASPIVAELLIWLLCESSRCRRY